MSFKLSKPVIALSIVITLIFIFAFKAGLKALSRMQINTVQYSSKYNVYDNPVQNNNVKYVVPIAINEGNYRVILTPKAQYIINAKIVHKKRYHMDWNAGIAPYDFALAWGDLANPKFANEIKYSQGGRWYRFRYGANCAFTQSYIYQHSSNNHLIPANEYIKRVIEELNTGDYVHMEGYLVWLNGFYKKGNVYWKSSLSRNDTGDGSCEVFYVKNITLINGVTSSKIKSAAFDTSKDITAEDYYEIANSHLTRKDYKNAVKNYELALKMAPDNQNIKNNLETARAKEKEFKWPF